MTDVGHTMNILNSQKSSFHITNDLWRVSTGYFGGHLSGSGWLGRMQKTPQDKLLVNPRHSCKMDTKLCALIQIHHFQRKVFKIVMPIMYYEI